MFEGSAGQGLHENRVQNELAYLKSLSKRMHADGLGAEIEIQEFENQRIWTYDDVMKLLRKGAPCDAHWNGTFFHPCMYDSLVTAVKKKGPKEWTVSVLYSDGEVGNDLKPNQIRLPLESLWHNENATRTSTVKSMTLEDLLKCCDNEEKNAKEVPKNVRVIKVPKLGQLHCKNGVRVQTSYDTHARFRIRILNAAGASDWSEFSKDVFVTAGALNNQKPPRATSYSVINGDITVQWPLQYVVLIYFLHTQTFSSHRTLPPFPHTHKHHQQHTHTHTHTNTTDMEHLREDGRSKTSLQFQHTRMKLK